MDQRYLTIEQLSQETGISKHTLRNWEKRYSFLKTIRQSNDHRLYPETEVTRLKNIKKLVDSGERISKAIAHYQLQKETCLITYHFPEVENKKTDAELLNFLNEFSFSEFLEDQNSKGLNLSRICLAKRIGISNEYQVILSSDNTILNSDLMSNYYRCFVGQKSSLLKIKPDQVRISDNIKSIIKNFLPHKPQKSIDYITRLGHLSGLAIPLFKSNHLVGLLYLNSTEANYFLNWDKEKNSFIQTLKSFAGERLSSHQLPTFVELLKDFKVKESVGETYEKKSFLSQLELLTETNIGTQLKYKDSVIKKAFLFNSHYCAYILSRCIDFFIDQGMKFRLDLTPQFNDAVRFELYLENEYLSQDWKDFVDSQEYKNLSEFVQEIGARVIFSDRVLNFDFPVEYSFCGTNHYSTLSHWV